jgi:hypothetical protein
MINNHRCSSIRVEVCEWSFLHLKHVKENDIILQSKFFQDDSYFPWIWRVWECCVEKLDIAIDD